MAIMQIDSKITQIKELSPSVKHFIIDLGKDIDMKAGQFINLSFTMEGIEYKRPYSIASPPSYNKNEKKIELCIKLVENGTLTPKLWKLKEGDSIHIMGPLGIFTLEKSDPNKDLIFIGTGTGIAPLRSMILDEIEKAKENQKNKLRNITLIFGVRHENEILYKDEFEKLEKENPNFKYIKVVSRPNNDWMGRTGHVQDNLGGLDILNSQVYMCGLPQMIEGTKKKLLELGMDENDIHHEIFK